MPRAGHKRAARQLGVNATTVGRRISALEQALGVRLLARTPEGLQATSAGLGLVSHAERMELEALSLELRSEPRRVDLSRREADLALRLLRPKEPSLSLGGSGSCSWRCLPVGSICGLAALSAHD